MYIKHFPAVLQVFFEQHITFLFPPLFSCQIFKSFEFICSVLYMTFLNIDEKRLHFLKYAFGKFFMSFIYFTICTVCPMYNRHRAPFSFSLMWAIYKVDITCAGLKLDARSASQTVKPAHDIL